MRSILLFFVFAIICSSAAAQYGKLEPLRDWDTVNVVLRTPKPVLEKLFASKDAVDKKKAKHIKEVERQLELARNAFLINRTLTMNTSFFTKTIKALQDLGIDIGYYLQEFFIYYPRPYERVTQ